MKNIKAITLILLLICIAATMFSCMAGKGVSASDVKVGMTQDELDKLLREADIFYGRTENSWWFRDKNNNSVTVTFAEDGKTVADVSSVKKDLKNYDFEKLEIGMKIDEVYEIFGAPYGSNTSGMQTVYYRTADGKDFYIIYYYPDCVNWVLKVVDGERTMYLSSKTTTDSGSQSEPQS